MRTPAVRIFLNVPGAGFAGILLPSDLIIFIIFLLKYHSNL